jgi:hypothetical protein
MEFEPNSGVGARAREIGGKHDRCDRAHHAGRNEGRKDRALNGDARVSRGFAIVADCVDRTAAVRQMKEDNAFASIAAKNRN